MTRIFIEGYELYLTQGLSNQITYAIDDLQNLDSKSTSFTKTIVLPGTANNNKLLGNIFDFNNANFDNPLDPNVLANFNAARNASARIEIDGLQIMKGVLRLLEIVHVDGAIEYECALFGELGGFINALGNKRLEDLDFSAYDHTYSYANIVASWNTTGSTSYCYPLIDYGNVSTDKINFQYKTFKPALFVREYLDKIFTGSGYTYECDLFNTSDFRKLIVPNNSKQLTKETSDVLKLTKAINQSMNEGGSQDFVSYETKVGSLFTASISDTLFTYNGTPTLTTNLTIELFGDYTLASRPLTIAVLKNGVAISGSSQTYNGTDLLYYNKSLSVTLATNDTLRVRTSCILDTGDEVNVSESTINVINNVATTAPIELGDTMVINNTIPKGIFQKDFVTSIMKMYNLLIVEDKYKTNHLVIKPYIDFYTGTIVDWSDKLDHSKAIKIKPMSEINARYYNFKYKQDNDFYNEDYRKKFNEGYGDRVYDNGLEFAKDTESVEIIFASSPLFGTSTTDKVFPAIYKKSDNNTKEDPMDHIMRIMQINKITGVTSWSILNGATNLGSNTAYLFCGHLNNPTTPNIDINFGAPQQLFFNLASGDLSYNLFNVYYSPYMYEITDKDSRLLTGFFDLTELDIFNIDFAKYYFIDGGLYRLIKVYDYSPETNDTTKVDLLRVIDAVGTDFVPSTTTTTTTTSTTTTTTTLATFDASYSMVSAYDVCNNVCPNPARPVETFTILAGGGTLCTATKLTSTLIANGTITGNFWLSACTGTSRGFTIIIEGGQFVAVWTEETCQTCPDVTTTTTTTTTSTTTTTTTAPPTTTTTSTTTTTTTPPPTTTTTSTTTTTTTPPPTTTTSTTTTTTTDPYDYYIADEIDCSNCSVVAADQRVSFPTGTSVTLNRYYRYVGFENDFTYYVKSATTAGGAVLLELPSYTNCNAACGNTTTTSTTTTTTTAAPTTTTSTTTTTTTPPPTTTTSTTTTTTTPPPTTTTSTTTTTTTYAPIGLTATPGCSGGAGTGTITANGFNGGSESFEYIAISSTSSSDALSRLDNSATRTFLGGATEFTYTMLANATYYVAIMDNVGNKGVSSGAVVNCVTTTTTTTSTTTTTTTAPPTTTTTSTTTTTTTAPPTTTTTSTTTTTTTLGYAFVDITNSTAGTDITNITINGVQVDGATFPIVAGDGASATTTQTGASRTIVVSYTNVSNDSVEVIDTASNLTCISATSTSRTFAAQVVNDGGTISVTMFDGSC
jgi:hypothetical protein